MSALGRIARVIAARAARGYLGGTDLAGALSTCDRLATRGIVAFTLGYWNRSGEAQEEVAGRYAETARHLAAPSRHSKTRIALKPPAFGFRREVLDSLLSHEVVLHLDSHGIEAQDATLALGLSSPSRIGVTLPGRWRRSDADARDAAQRGLTVRVVKGQFPAKESSERDASEGFLAVVDALARGAAKVLVATHDPRLARRALAWLREVGTPCELELLYGLPSAPVLAVANELRVPCRVYVPWGIGYLPYALAGLRRDPSVALRLARDFATAGRHWDVRGSASPQD